MTPFQQKLIQEVDPKWAYGQRKAYLKTLIEPLVLDYLILRDLLSEYTRKGLMMDVIAVQMDMALIRKCLLKYQNELYFRRRAMSGECAEITQDDIRRAKEYPFEELLPVVRGRVACPFHEDKHPSASVKNNKLHCFVCNRTWDTIDFFMELNGRSFADAVRSLQ